MKYILFLILIVIFIAPQKSNAINKIEPDVRIFEKVETWWDGKEYRFICIEISGLDLEPFTNLRKKQHIPGENSPRVEHSNILVSYENQLTFTYWDEEAKWFLSKLEPYLFLFSNIGTRTIKIHEKMIKVLDNNTLQAYFLFDEFNNLPDNIQKKDVYSFHGFTEIPNEISFHLFYSYHTNIPPISSLPNWPENLGITNFTIYKNKIEPLNEKLYDSKAPLATRVWFIEWFENNPDVMPPKYANFKRLLNQ